METEDEWAWEIAVARARAAADDSALETDPADVLEEHVEEVEDWEAIIAAARVRASSDDLGPAEPATAAAPLASGSSDSIPLARGSQDVIARPPPHEPVPPPRMARTSAPPPMSAYDPSVPRTVIPVPALQSADPERVREYDASMRGGQLVRSKASQRRT